MCDEFIHPGLVEDLRLSRRSFGLLTVAGAGVAAAPALACVCKTAEPRDGVRTAAGFAARVVAVSRGPPVSH